METILSIDGGGVRGYAEAIVLNEIEKSLREKTGNDNVNLAHYCNVISGASTGGILAAILTCPDDNGNYKYDCSDAVKFYKDHCYEIFNKSKRYVIGGLTYKYSAKTLEKLLKKYLGDVRMEDLKNHVIIPTIDLIENKAVFLSNIKKDDEHGYVLARDACRMTSSAPTYFKPYEGHGMVCIDGGLVANDTTMCCVAKLRNYTKPKLKDVAIINIGSGSLAPDIKRMKNWHLLKWGTNITNIMMNANIGLVKYQADTMMFGKNFAIDIADMDKGYSAEMADGSKKNMKELERAAIATINKNKRLIYNIVDFLIKNKEST